VIHLDRHKLRGIGETLAWLAGRRRRVRIVGDSMLPTLAAGQYVLVDEGRSPRPGQLALARHPHQHDLLVVKRVLATTADGRFELISDNPGAGTDSRTWGPVDPDRVLGAVTLLLDRPSTRLERPDRA
jgi:nickel-type superoxide dismutase maturation protease